MDVYSGEQKQAGYVVLLWQYKMQLEVIQVPKFDAFLSSVVSWSLTVNDNRELL